LTGVALRDGEEQSVVVASVTGKKGSAAATIMQEFPITIIDENTLTALAIDVPASVPANGEPFTPGFTGTYDRKPTYEGVTFNTAGATLSFKGPVAGTKYVEIIDGDIYPRLPGTVSIIGTMTVTPPGETDSKDIKVSKDVQIVDTPLTGVKLESDETPATTTVNVGKAIQFKATAEYGSVTQDVTTAVVWISSDPTIAMASNASGSFGGPGKVTGVAPGPVDIKGYYRSKLVGTVAVTVAP
jgi:hypothetical protein